MAPQASTPAASTEASPLGRAWQPFTFRGVAAFALARSRRLWIVALLFNQAAAVGLLWFVLSCWHPVVEQALQLWPDEAHFRNRLFVWNQTGRPLETGNKFLQVHLSQDGTASAAGDLQLVLTPSSARLCSLPGCLVFAYPAWQDFEAGQLDARAAWEAWKLWLLIGGWLAVSLGLLLSWLVLSAVYLPAAWVSAVFMDRQRGLGALFRMGLAAQLPGALLMTGAVGLYGFGLIDLLGFTLFFILHVVCGWIYLGGGLRSLPRISGSGGGTSRKKNPFQPKAASL